MWVSEQVTLVVVYWRLHVVAAATHRRSSPCTPPDRMSVETPVAQRVNALSPATPSCAPRTDPADAASAPVLADTPATSHRGGGVPHAPGCFSACPASACLLTVGDARATAKSSYSLYDATSGPNPRPSETAVAADAREHIPWPGRMTTGYLRTSAPVHTCSVSTSCR
eukprot:COSAG02_NODE_2570_length_8510_cov_6.332541_2_plen_168_part_00